MTEKWKGLWSVRGLFPPSLLIFFSFNSYLIFNCFFFKEPDNGSEPWAGFSVAQENTEVGPVSEDARERMFGVLPCQLV